MFFVRDGQCEVTLELDAPGFVVLGAGQHFGEAALLSTEARNAFVVSRTAMRLFVLTKAHLESVSADFPGLLEAIREPHEEQKRMRLQHLEAMVTGAHDATSGPVAETKPQVPVVNLYRELLGLATEVAVWVNKMVVTSGVVAAVCPGTGFFLRDSLRADRPAIFVYAGQNVATQAYKELGLEVGDTVSLMGTIRKTKYETFEVHVSEREWAEFSNVIEVLNDKATPAELVEPSWKVGARDRKIEEIEAYVQRLQMLLDGPEEDSELENKMRELETSKAEVEEMLLDDDIAEHEDEVVELEDLILDIEQQLHDLRTEAAVRESLYHPKYIQNQQLELLRKLADVTGRGDCEMCRRIVRSVGGIPLVVQLLSSENEQVAGTAAYGLANICCNDAPNREAAGMASAVPAVVSQLIASLSPLLRDHGAFTLGTLCCEDMQNKAAALKANAVESLVVLLAGPATSTRRHAAWALGNVLDGYDAAKAALRRCGGISALVALLGHPDAAVSRNAVTTLGIACVEDNASCVYASNAGAVQRIMHMLSSRDLKLKRQAAWTLGHLVSGDEHTRASATKLQERQGSSIVQLVGMLSSDSAAVKASAGFALQSLLAPVGPDQLAPSAVVGELLKRQTACDGAGRSVLEAQIAQRGKGKEPLWATGARGAPLRARMHHNRYLPSESEGTASEFEGHSSSYSNSYGSSCGSSSCGSSSCGSESWSRSQTSTRSGTGSDWSSDSASDSSSGSSESRLNGRHRAVYLEERERVRDQDRLRWAAPQRRRGHNARRRRGVQISSGSGSGSGSDSGSDSGSGSIGRSGGGRWRGRRRGAEQATAVRRTRQIAASSGTERRIHRARDTRGNGSLEHMILKGNGSGSGRVEVKSASALYRAKARTGAGLRMQGGGTVGGSLRSELQRRRYPNREQWEWESQRHRADGGDDVGDRCGDDGEDGGVTVPAWASRNLERLRRAEDVRATVRFAASVTTAERKSKASSICTASDVVEPQRRRHRYREIRQHVPR
eukprot:SAG11_NODE_444_length_9421_cov_9.885540_2_plen_1011_part_00